MRREEEERFEKNLQGIMDDIIAAEKHYYNNCRWMSSVERKKTLTKIHRLSQHYNDIVTKRALKAEPNRIQSLHVPGEMPEAEKLKLIQLIEST